MEYGILEALHPELPGPEDRIVDFSEGKGGCHLARGRGRITPSAIPSPWTRSKTGTTAFSGWTRECSRPSWIGERVLQKDGMPAENTYSAEAVRTLDTHRTPIQKQPEVLLCLVGTSRRYYVRDEVLIRAPNPTKVKTESRPCAAHEVPLLNVTANRVIEIEDPAADTDSSGVPSTIERSPLDFTNEDEASDQETIAPEVPSPEDVPTTKGAPKVLRRDHADPRPTGSTREGKSLAAVELGMASTRLVPVPESAPVDVSDPDSLSFADPRSHHLADVAQSSQGTAAAGDSESENTSFASVVGSPESIYRPEWGVANGSMLDTPEAWQDLVDYVAPPGYFFELRHLHNDDFLRQYNVKLARQVEMGSQLRLRSEQEAKLLKKSVRDNHLLQQVATLQEQVSGEEKLKAVFEEFKQYEDNRVEQRCAEMDARLDALSIDFDEELYPHMLTAIADRRWMIGRGLPLAVMKCGESLELRQAFADVVSAGIAKGMSKGLKHGVEHMQAQLSLESIEAYDPEAEAKYIAALQALKDLKYPLVDQLEGLKDAPMDVIMAALYLKSDTGDDVPQQVRDLRPSSSQLTIPVYPEPCEEEEKCRIVCRTHGVGSAHHARSDGVHVSVPTVVPQGLAILLADVATQTEPDEATLDNS
nr:hypothetical protein [Tanacetum cinerariifolium]